MGRRRPRAPRAARAWRQTARAALAFALAALVTACAGDSPAGLVSPPPTASPVPPARPRASVSVAAGDAQIGTPGSPLGMAPSVRVTDAAGAGVSGLTVRFAVLSGGGSVASPATVTDLQGHASAGEWTLGDEPGTQELEAIVEGVGSVTFHATARPRIAAELVILRGDGQSATAGTEVPIDPAVRVVDAGGNPVSGVEVTFVATAGGGSVGGATRTTGADGRATVGSWTLGPTPGENTLEAIAAGSGISGNPVTFRATATPPGGGGSAFDIEIRFAAGSSPTAVQRDAFEDAENRWERVVSGDLPPVAVNRPTGACSSTDPLVETIDDLVIFVTLETIDGPGGVLGTAGPCMVRSGSTLPLVGRMRFDTADLATLESNGILAEVILHEMGHVLGIGTLWKTLGLLADPVGSGGVDPHFTGTAAIDAFDAIGGSGYAGQKVPVEDTGGSGTRDGHWRESVFDRELMTGWVDPGHNPLSRVTIQSLADLGYAVDAGEAESVGIAVSPSFVPWSGTGRRALRLADDVWRGPIEIVDPTGRPMPPRPR